MTKKLIAVSGLQKKFRLGLTRKKVEAVCGIDFEVSAGDIFGFLGPNGAGKTTTIKMLTGLITPSAGTAQLFGRPVSEPKSRESVGFLPENPYIYPYLTPQEFVVISGQLAGLSGQKLKEQVAKSLKKTGIYYAKDRPARRLSKGMLQRTGMAAALVAEPELLILDEPMSGLDPIGRKEIKDLIIDERAQGRTIFFSTHILGDVETLCDRVTIMRKGKIVVRGRLDELLQSESQFTQLNLTKATEDFEAACRTNALKLTRVGTRLSVEVRGGSACNELIQQALTAGAEIESVTPIVETLEDLFVREAILGHDSL